MPIRMIRSKNMVCRDLNAINTLEGFCKTAKATKRCKWDFTGIVEMSFADKGIQIAAIRQADKGHLMAVYMPPGNDIAADILRAVDTNRDQDVVKIYVFTESDYNVFSTLVSRDVYGQPIEIIRA